MPHDLTRFLDAQAAAYPAALAELRGGRKRTHWMWFVFPQVEGLGRSPTARFYAIAGLDEARAYLAHPVLGARLIACVEAILALPGDDAHAVFGAPDDLKLRSSLTLFSAAAPDEPRFRAALDKYFGGRDDPQTLARL
ncbi:calpastatin [Caulobacter vibrioides]|nr:calpastatin [Caulobacter vibrioides]